jgi:hypothetical protein
VVAKKAKKAKLLQRPDVSVVRSMSEVETNPGDILIDGDVRSLVTPMALIEVRHMMTDQEISRMGTVVPMLSKGMKTTKGTVRGPTFTLVGSDMLPSALPVQGQPAANGEIRHEVPETLKQVSAALKALSKV